MEIKRRVIVLIAILLVLMAGLFLAPDKEDFENKNNLITGNAIYNPPQISECSETEIRNIWEDLFTESFNGAIVDYNASDNNCIPYIVYDIVNDEELFLLIGKKAIFENSFTKDIIAIHGNFSNQYANQIKEMDYTDAVNFNGPEALENSIENREISSSSEAASKWEKFFQIPIAEIEYNNFDKFIYENKEEIDKGFIYETQSIYTSKNYEQFTYSKNINNTSSEGFEGLKENYNLEVNGEEYNSSENYEGEQEIKIKYENKPKIEFEWDFSNELNLSDLDIKTQQFSDNFGYTIVNGLEIEKTIYIDKKIEDSQAICIRDEHIEDIDEMTDSCSSSRETPLSCTGINSACTIIGDTFVVSGVRNSAVKEFFMNISLPRVEDCNPNWSCNEWSRCLNGKQVRVCIDLNSCHDQESRPIEERDCDTEQDQTCTNEWLCEDWSECEDGKQIRVCEDINNCEIEKEKPDEERECELHNEEKITTIANVIFYSIILFFSAFYWIVFYYLMKRRFFDSNIAHRQL